MDIQYVTKGEQGKTCADCQVFESTSNGMGRCFGHEVLAAGSYNMFSLKQPIQNEQQRTS